MCLRNLSVSHNLIADPWALLPLLSLPAITWLSISPQRVPNDPLTSAPGSTGIAGALYRHLVVLLTIHSEGSQQQVPPNCKMHTCLLGHGICARSALYRLECIDVALIRLLLTKYICAASTNLTSSFSDLKHT